MTTQDVDERDVVTEPQQLSLVGPEEQQRRMGRPNCPAALPPSIAVVATQKVA